MTSQDAISPDPMKENHSQCCWGDFLAGFGQLLIGIAAVLAVFFAKNPVTNFLNNKVVVTNIININQCKADEQAKDIIDSGDNDVKLNQALSEAAEQTIKNSGQPVGLYIAPRYLGEVKSELKGKESVEAKKRVLEYYWNKSVSEEIKQPASLRLNGDK